VKEKDILTYILSFLHKKKKKKYILSFFHFFKYFYFLQVPQMTGLTQQLDRLIQKLIFKNKK
jgi:hypothetical protein